MQPNRNNLPSLPRIRGDLGITIDVLTHRSLRATQHVAEAGTMEGNADPDRLAVLGSSVYQLVITDMVLGIEPKVNIEEARELIKAYTSPASKFEIVEHYQMKKQIRFLPTEIHLGDDVNEMACILDGYIGALYVRNSFDEIYNWLKLILNTPSDTSTETEGYTTVEMSEPAGAVSSTGIHIDHVSVSLFNEMAQQRGVTVTYPQESSGPPHIAMWTVRCYVNGIEKGVGRGQSVKAAKRTAVKAAWQALGWQESDTSSS
ncbi:hypothetical protein NMY22_g3715 [Coprinellus aureogranulatus]|nr:hypothetical protein NMY22_g3715 [Coprinellus aureogranulatus]